MNSADPTLSDNLRRTSPKRAKAVGYFLVFGGGLLWLAILSDAFGGLEERLGTFLVGLGVSGLGFVYLCLAVRCPQCGRRIFWEAVTSREAS